MPTGYTYPVVDGKITELPDFALSCARAFGALITMREEPMDKPLPDEIKPDTKYYDERLAADQKRLGDVQAMTNAECEAAAELEHQEALASRASWLARQDEEAARLNAMLVKVRAWQPPTRDHVEMKSFMIDQLVKSLPGSYTPAIPERLDGATWRQRTIDSLAKSVVQYNNQISDEIIRASGRTEWLQQLRKSLAA